MRSAERSPHLLRLAAAGLALAALVSGCSDGGSTGSAPTPTPPPTSVSVAPTPTPPPSASPSAASPRVTAISPALKPFYEQKLRWTACGSNQCATLRVPVNYLWPDEDDVVELPLLRNPASSSKRIGSLVVNPGGPGGSGVSYARRADAFVPSELRSRYDLVGFDPRGVQASSPNIDCLTDAQLDRFLSADTTAANAAAQERDAKTFARGCAKRSKDLYGYVGTRDAAKDLDVLRAALGEKKLDYLGLSYGTLLGATYAETFPDRVGRMVLDGVLDPALDPEPLLRGQTAGFDRAYRAFLGRCVKSACPLGSAVDAAYARTVAWLDELERKPMAAPGGRELTRSLAVLAILGSLYEDRTQWASLQSALRSALAGRPAAMLAIADNAVGRQPGGRFPDNSNEVQYAITCLDRAYTDTVASTAARATRLAARSPVFGEYLAWGDLPCTEWRTAPTRLAHRLDPTDIPPILLIGTSRDPATPLAWAKSLHEQLPNSRLVTWKGDGHLAYARGSACVTSIADTFLIRGELPAGDRTCTGR